MLKFISSCWQEDAQRRYLWFPVLFATGILFYFNLKVEPSKWITLGVIEGLIILAIIFRYRITILKILSCLAFIVAGFTVVQVKSIYLSALPQELPTDSFYFKGQITSIDTNYQGRPRFIFDGIEDFDGNFYSGKYRITQRSKKHIAEVGDCVELVGKIMPLSKAVMVDGYQFDRKGYFEGLKGSGFAESRWFKIDCPTNFSKHNFNIFISHIRSSIVKHIYQILPPQQASITSVILAGERGGIDEKQYEQYRNSGLAHFLSISGLHMSMLAGLMFFFIRFILALIPAISLRFDSKKIAAVFALIISICYLFISGHAIPVQRAFIMTFIVLLGVLTDRRAISMNTIAIAAFIVLFISPEAIISASFQMSFAAVLGLIAFYEKISSKLQIFLHAGRLNKWFKGIIIYILGIIISDFIASIMTMPFAIYHFNMIAIYTTLGNFLAGPIIGIIIMPFVLLSLLLMPLSLDFIPLKIVGYGIDLVNKITAWVSYFPNAGYQVPSIPQWGLIFLVLGFLWLILWQSKWRYWGIIAIVLGLFSAITIRTPDILISPEGKAIAVKNNKGELEIVPLRSGRFVKDIWRNKYNVVSTKGKLENYPELSIDNNIVRIKDKQYNLNNVIGISVYFDKNNVPEVKTIRDYIGYRFWNKK